MTSPSKTTLPGNPPLHLGLQASARPGAEDVLYVHGATFPSALSVFFRFDGRSWADALNAAGFNAWGLDFAGYGESGRPPAMEKAAHESEPVGRSADAAAQIRRAISFIMERNGDVPVNVIAHSWGTVAAGRLSAESPELVRRLVLFGPVARRESVARVAPVDGWRLVNVWEQYRRFIEDVPRGSPPVLLDHHMDAWAKAYLASDPQSASRTPPSVKTPNGPAADVVAAWSGELPYDPSRIRCPLLIVRGEWDPVCNDEDARWLLEAAGSAFKRDVKLPRGTHLMHLEENRESLYAATAEFLGHTLSPALPQGGGSAFVR